MLEWIRENDRSFKDQYKTSIIAGQNAITYSYEHEFWLIDSVVLSIPESGDIYSFDVGYYDKNDPIRKDFQKIISTTQFLLTIETLKNAEYIYENNEKLTFNDGHSKVGNDFEARFETSVFADLNNDGIEDAAVVFWYWGGGSGSFFRLAAVINKNSRPQNVATASLGNRIKLNSLVIKSGMIIVDFLERDGLPNSPRHIVNYKLSGKKLVVIGSKKYE